MSDVLCDNSTRALLVASDVEFMIRDGIRPKYAQCSSEILFFLRVLVCV